MTPRRDATKLKRLRNQYNKYEGNPEMQRKIALRIQTIENTKTKRR